jgi:hypothetical protein
MKLVILRQYEDRIRPDSHIGLEWHSILGIADSHGVVTKLIAVIRTITIPIAVESDTPQAALRKTQAVTVVTAI